VIYELSFPQNLIRSPNLLDNGSPSPEIDTQFNPMVSGIVGSLQTRQNRPNFATITTF
jgi:hypothetical protein